MLVAQKTIENKFQSTLSVRRATHEREPLREAVQISIHALRKESDHNRPQADWTLLISIHALRKESDDVDYGSAASNINFNPRSP